MSVMNDKKNSFTYTNKHHLFSDAKKYKQLRQLITLLGSFINDSVFLPSTFCRIAFKAFIEANQYHFNYTTIIRNSINHFGKK